MGQPRENPFKPIYAACNSGNSAHKLANLPDAPRYIDIELTNTCNFRCLMCPTGTHMQQRDSGFMSEETFNRVLEQIAPYKIPLRFIRWGEPTLHKQFVEFLTRAKALGIPLHMNTNGSKMDDALMDALLAIPLDSIKFSFQGVDAPSYEEMRNTDFFAELMDVIKALHAKRGDGRFPYLHVSTTITYEDAERVAAFRAAIEPYADMVTVGRTILEHMDPKSMRCSQKDLDTLLRLKDAESVVKKHPECPEVFDKLSINWDGSVSACCGDFDQQMVVGDINAQSLDAIWRSEQLNRYREMLAQMRHDELPLCRTCYDYMGLQTPGLQQT
ncbi:radical SAM/SPASM domain-containing protein [Magnetofaba australis]|nr:radical SAM protein [Magnetofaba australis]